MKQAIKDIWIRPAPMAVYVNRAEIVVEVPFGEEKILLVEIKKTIHFRSIHLYSLAIEIKSKSNFKSQYPETKPMSEKNHRRSKESNENPKNQCPNETSPSPVFRSLNF